jgi:FKBP-type peptidyl-prolyl cis-trans isomerase
MSYCHVLRLARLLKRSLLLHTCEYVSLCCTGMEGMRVGGQRELIIPSGLGYGKQGAGPIGPNQDLVFHVELLDVSGR